MDWRGEKYKNWFKDRRNKGKEILHNKTSNPSKEARGPSNKQEASNTRWIGSHAMTVASSGGGLRNGASMQV
jgi:hypothetical protein